MCIKSKSTSIEINSSSTDATEFLLSKSNLKLKIYQKRIKFIFKFRP